MLNRTAALKSFLENSKKDLQVCLERTISWMFYLEVSNNFRASSLSETMMDACFQKFKETFC